MTEALRRRRPAMATFFEVLLLGEDEAHLAAVADAALDEVQRVELQLSRFDPAGEVARINREARAGPVRVDLELLRILLDCRAWRSRTDGAFDVAAGHRRAPSGAAAPSREDRPACLDDVEIDAGARSVRLRRPDVALDFGGLGKGYALERVAGILARFGVRAALVHGGTSSVLAVGRAGDGRPWPVGLRDPFTEEEVEIEGLRLGDRALSSSAVFPPRGEAEPPPSDIVDPRSGRSLEREEGCAVVAPGALEAEVLSTALLAMGRARAVDWLARNVRPGLHVAWIDRGDRDSNLSWLTEQP